MTAAKAENLIVTQDVAKDPAATAILAKYETLSAPLANRVVGTITADILSARDTATARTRPASSRWATSSPTRMLAATRPTDFGGAVAAFMNPGGVRASLLVRQITGGERPGEVTYAEAFTVQPFGNTLVVKTCTGAAALRRAEPAVQQPVGRPDRIMARLGRRTYSYDRGAAGRRASSPGSLRDDGALVDKARPTASR